MNKWMMLVLAFALSLPVQAASPGNEGYLPMPLKFSLESDHTEVMKNYPLGVITKMAAFTHHGQPHKTVELPNGLEGWMYENVLKKNKSFKMSSGEKREMESMEDAHFVSTYTLVFDSGGVVRDVLYQEPSHGNAESALLVQRVSKPDVEKSSGVHDVEMMIGGATYILGGVR